MEIRFTGKFDEIEQQANKWVQDHPALKLIWRSGRSRVGYRDGQDIYEKDDWTITIEYEEAG